MNKKHVFIGVYILLLIVELFFYVPYEKIEIFRSDQNVPHTEIVGNGYTTLDEIKYDVAWLANSERTTTGKRVDSGQLATNLFSTTAGAVFIYLVFIYSEDKNRSAKTENELLQRKVDVLNYDNQILHEYRDMFIQLKTALAETANSSTMGSIKEIPTIDIDALAFADEETQNSVLKQYTNNISAYTAYKIYAALRNEAKE